MCNQGVCGCRRGYRLMADGYSCLPIKCVVPSIKYCPPSRTEFFSCRHPSSIMCKGVSCWERERERERERDFFNKYSCQCIWWEECTLPCNEVAASSLLVVCVTYSKSLIQYSFEDTCTVSCITDWFLKGPTNTITCLANSTWSHPQLFCAPPNNPPHSVGSTFIICKISLKFGLESHCVHYIMSIETMTVTII